MAKDIVTIYCKAERVRKHPGARIRVETLSPLPTLAKAWRDKGRTQREKEP
jgi:hypothetical protein